jgi:hypothetical protein
VVERLQVAELEMEGEMKCAEEEGDRSRFEADSLRFEVKC